MAIQNDNTIVTKGDLKDLYTNKIAPYLGMNIAMNTNNKEYYSTDEKVIGVWIDGKPIYQKTVTITSINYTGSNDLGMSSASVDTIVSYFGNSYLANGSAYALNSSNNDGLNYCTGAILEVVDHVPNLSLRFGTGRRTMAKIEVTLQYTKTTDIAGSATITPGCYDINFPNTWPENTEIYFGNGLYGYRIIRTNVTFAAYFAELQAISGGPNHTCNMINSAGYAVNSNGGKDNIRVCYFNSNDTIGLKGTWSGGTVTQTKIDVWLTYTK